MIGGVQEELRPVILFDGVCHLCNGFVRFVLRWDRSGQFDFAPLESQFGQEKLGSRPINSVVLLENGQQFEAEIAVLRILSRLGAPWSWIARVLSLFPQRLLAWGYRMVARYRYRLFGKDEVCALPRPEWEGRFRS